MTATTFRDREDAGRALARSLAAYAGRGDLLVLGMARGGVAVARAVAHALGAPLDVAVARKLGVPGIEEVALGAVAEGDGRVVGDDVGWYIGVPPHVVARVAARERTELARRVRLYRGGRPAPDVRGRTVVVVDDGLATGATLRATVRALRARRPARVVVAVPVANAARARELRAEVDDLVAVVSEEAFGTVSAWYDAFPAVSDAEVLALLGQPSAAPHGGSPAPAGESRTVTIPVDGGLVEADLEVPNDARGRAAAGARGLAVLAHGGGSSRRGFRNRYLAGRLRLAGFATLRVDLLTAAEQALDAETAAERFDVARIGRRLIAACDWAAREGAPGAERVALLGASTGAAAALLAAAERPGQVAAVVSRGGRVDLAGDAASRVRAPTLLIVGGADAPTLQWNRDTMHHLPRRTRLTVIPDAGHTFEEPGALGAVAEHATRWLERHVPEQRRKRWWLF